MHMSVREFVWGEKDTWVSVIDILQLGVLNTKENRDLLYQRTGHCLEQLASVQPSKYNIIFKALKCLADTPFQGIIL